MKINQIKGWFQEQWEVKTFRVLVIAMLCLSCLMGLEFRLFQYGYLKCIRYLCLFWSLGMLGWIDQRSRRIPNRILGVLLFIRTMLLITECLIYQEYWMSFVFSACLGAFFSGGMFLLCYGVSRGGIGAGDVKLLAVLGYYLGAGAIFTAVFLIVLSAAIFSVGALVLKKVNLKQEMPFAPFVLVGTAVAMLLGI